MSFDAGGGPGGIDPSSLHLKKELTQIRKAARVLRDPGTSSSSRRRPTPLTKHHYVHHRRINGNEITTPSFPPHSNADDTSNDDSNNPASDDHSNKGNVSVVGTEKRVFLCNWRSQSKKSKVRDDEEESFLSSSSKSEAYFKNKPKRSSGSNYRISVPKPKKRVLSTSSLVDQSDEDYLNSEDITSRASAISPLLARFNKTQGRALSLKREEDSISYSNKYGVRNPSTVGSWNSLNDVDDEVEEEQQGCGIPCYNWSKRSTPKSRFGYGSGSCGSPSIPDSLRRKGSSIFSRTQSINHRRRSGKNKRTPTSKIPLLTSDDDDLAANFEELDLEALSRLDRKRWSSSCRSREGLELVVVDDREEEEESSPENARSLSHKYRPVFFEELVGQNIVVQSLRSSISRKRISPVYLFHGPRGTGKTAAARIFATALNCLASEENNNDNNIKPCGVCRECTDSISGESANIIEVDGSNKVGIDKIKSLLSSLSVGRGLDFSQFKVFVVDECHLLPSKMWLGFLRLAEKPLPNVIFVLVTTDMDNLPRSVLSRCQKHLFSKIENSDIVARLRKIGENEDLDVDTDALEMIAMNVDGSLRDAETMLDQLSLFGKRIEASLVNELLFLMKPEVVVTGMAQYESVTSSSFEQLLNVTREIGCRLLLDISDHFELSSLPSSNGVFKYLAGNTLPSHATIVCSLLKNQVYSDLEVAFVISEEEAMFKALCKTVELLQGSTSIISQYYYGCLFHELLAFQLADRHPPAQRISANTRDSKVNDFSSSTISMLDHAELAVNESDESPLVHMDVDQIFLPITKPVQASIFESFARQNIIDSEIDVTGGIKQLVSSSYGFPSSATTELIYADCPMALFSKLVLCCIQESGTLCFPTGSNGNYVSAAKFLNAKFAIIPTNQEVGYKLTEKTLISALDGINKPWIYISGPTISPTGLVYSNEEISKLLAVCAKFGARVILDTSFSGVEFNSKGFEGWKLGETLEKLSSASSPFCVSLLGGLFFKMLTGGINFGFLLIDQPSLVETFHSFAGLNKPHGTTKYTVKKLLDLKEEKRGDLLNAISEQTGILGSRYKQLKQTLESSGWEVIEAQAGVSIIAKPSAYLGKTIKINKGTTTNEIKLDDSNIREALLRGTGLCINSAAWTGIPGYCRFTFALEEGDFKRALDAIAKFKSLAS